MRQRKNSTSWVRLTTTGHAEKSQGGPISRDQRGVGRVLSTGQPIIVPDTSKDPYYYGFVDDQMRFKSRNMLDVPLKSGERIIGVLCAINKKNGVFDPSDVELLNLIASTVALSIENARYAKEVTEAYKELASLNRAKDRAINHLSTS